jgi:hypothetical protein
MNTVQKLFALSVISLASMSASAELISTDWKVSGDAKAALDTVSGKEWLSLNETSGYAYNNIQELIQTEFINWRLGTEAEVAELMFNTFGALPYYNGSAVLGGGQYDNEQSFRNTLGYSYSNTMSIGLVYSDTYDHLGISGFTKGSNSGYAYNTEVNHSHRSSGWEEAGIFLVSDGGTTLSSINDPSINANANVPLPATAALLGLGLLGFGAPRKKSTSCL